MDKKKLAELTDKVNKSYYINYPENVIRGKDVFINYGFTCLANEKVYIGDNVLIGPNVTIATVYHDELKHKTNKFGKVKIGNNVIIYMGSLICPGVTIGENSIIGAGSVVINDIPANVLAAGNPCKPIRAVKTETLK